MYTIKPLRVAGRSGRIVNNPHIRWPLDRRPCQLALAAMVMRRCDGDANGEDGEVKRWVLAVRRVWG